MEQTRDTVRLPDQESTWHLTQNPPNLCTIQNMRHIIQNAKFKTHDTKKAPGTLIPTQPNSALKTQYTRNTNVAHCTNRCTTLYIFVQHCVCHSSCGWLLGPPSPPGHRQSPPPGSERPWIRPVFCHHRSILHCVVSVLHNFDCTLHCTITNKPFCLVHGALYKLYTARGDTKS